MLFLDLFDFRKIDLLKFHLSLTKSLIINSSVMKNLKLEVRIDHLPLIDLH